MQHLIKIAIVAMLAIIIMTASNQSVPKKQEPVENTPPPTDDIEYMEVPDFVNQQANYLHYDNQLGDFWRKLKELQEGKRERLHILHIGDSHLQAGFLPGELRRLFQISYGHAGRGLVFPYRLAKTNAPSDIRSQSNIEWICERNIDRDASLPIGICGYSLQTTNPNFDVTIQLKNANDHFDKVTVFGPTGQDAFDLELSPEDSTNRLISRKLPFKSGSCFMLNDLQTTIHVKGKKTENSQRQYIIQGLLLENTRNKGILYSSIGVNGATYMAYNRSTDFMEQVAALQPDLVIVSLGTNEAANSKMSTPWVKDQLETFLKDIRKQTDCRSMLLVTPPDIYIRYRYRTRNGEKLAEMMHDVAKVTEGIAIWDFYEVMGGYGSINKWKYAKLANNDRVHYTANGYRLQAQLLFKAFMNSFKKY